jgi:hypothetical protein
MDGTSSEKSISQTPEVANDIIEPGIFCEIPIITVEWPWIFLNAMG